MCALIRPPPPDYFETDSISCDIAGSLDNVAHQQMAPAPGKFGDNASTRRITHNWLRGGFFQVICRTSTGINVGKPTNSLSELPQGGVPSPFLRLMFFNHIPEHVETIRATERKSPFSCRGPLVADDVTMIISDSAPDRLRRRAAKRRLGSSIFSYGNQKRVTPCWSRKPCPEGSIAALLQCLRRQLKGA